MWFITSWVVGLHELVALEMVAPFPPRPPLPPPFGGHTFPRQLPTMVPAYASWDRPLSPRGCLRSNAADRVPSVCVSGQHRGRVDRVRSVGSLLVRVAR